MKLFAVAFLTFFISLTITFIPSNVSYASESGDAVCETVGRVSGQGCNATVKSGSGISKTIKTGLNLLSIAAGIMAVVMVIIGGVKYITSGGDSGKVSSAKNSIVFALVGIVIVALSQSIVFFVIKTFE